MTKKSCLNSLLEIVNRINFNFHCSSSSSDSFISLASFSSLIEDVRKGFFAYYQEKRIKGKNKLYSWSFLTIKQCWRSENFYFEILTSWNIGKTLNTLTCQKCFCFNHFSWGKKKCWTSIRRYRQNVAILFKWFLTAAEFCLYLELDVKDSHVVWHKPYVLLARIAKPC